MDSSGGSDADTRGCIKEWTAGTEGIEDPDGGSKRGVSSILLVLVLVITGATLAAGRTVDVEVAVMLVRVVVVVNVVVMRTVVCVCVVNVKVVGSVVIVVVVNVLVVMVSVVEPVDPNPVQELSVNTASWLVVDCFVLLEEALCTTWLWTRSAFLSASAEGTAVPTTRTESDRGSLVVVKVGKPVHGLD